MNRLLWRTAAILLSHFSYKNVFLFRTSKKWLDAQSEHKTTLRALPACLTLCDLKHDGYHQLVTAEFPMDVKGKSKLKAYKGTTLISEQSLPGIPVAIDSFYVDEHVPKIPGKE